MTRHSAILALSACLLLVLVAGCRVQIGGIPGVALGLGGLGGAGFGNPAMQVGQPGWLVGIWAPETAGCGLGQDVLFDANGDYRSPDRTGRWFLIDGTLTVRGMPGPPIQSGVGHVGPGQPVAGQSVVGRQDEVSWQMVDAAQDHVGLLSGEGTIVYHRRCAGPSQATGF